MFPDATVDTSSGSGEIDFLIATKMQQQLYLRAEVVLTAPSEISYTEEVAFDIDVINPCELIGSNILQNAISDIEYWIGDGSNQVVLGTGYWDDQWS